MREFFAARGLEYNPHPDVVPNTMSALRLTELARDLDRHGELHDRLMDAYWAEAQDIGDTDVLRTLAGESGCPRTRSTTCSRASATATASSTRHARR